jgi:hypothetical protein
MGISLSASSTGAMLQVITASFDRGDIADPGSTPRWNACHAGRPGLECLVSLDERSRGQTIR